MFSRKSSGVGPPAKILRRAGAAATARRERQEEAAVGCRKKLRDTIVIGEFQSRLERGDRAEIHLMLVVEIGVFLLVRVGDAMERGEIEDQVRWIGRIDARIANGWRLPVRS